MQPCVWGTLCLVLASALPPGRESSPPPPLLYSALSLLPTAPPPQARCSALSLSPSLWPALDSFLAPLLGPGVLETALLALGWRTVPPPSLLSGAGLGNSSLHLLTPQLPTHPAPQPTSGSIPGQPGSNQRDGDECQQSPCVPPGPRPDFAFVAETRNLHLGLQFQKYYMLCKRHTGA